MSKVWASGGFVRLWRWIFPSGAEFWGVLAQVARICAGPLVILILSATLPTSELARWYIFVALFGLAGLLEAGISQIFGRHVAFVHGSVQAGQQPADVLSGLVRYGVLSLLKVLPWLGLIAGLGGAFWLHLHQKPADDALVSARAYLGLWAIYAVGGCAFIGNYFLAAVLSGAGLMARAHQISAVGSLLNAGLLLVLAHASPTLVAPVLAYFVSQWIATGFYVWAMVSAGLLAADKECAGLGDQVKTDMKRDVPRGLQLMASYQLLTAGFALLVFKNTTTTTFAQFGLTMQIGGVAIGFASVWSGAAFQRLAAARSSWSRIELRRHFFHALLRSLLVCAGGLLALAIGGAFFLVVLKAKTTMLPAHLTAVLFMVLWLEFFSAMFMQFCFSQGSMRLATFNLLAASVVVLVSWLGFGADFPMEQVMMARALLMVVLLAVPGLFATRALLRTMPGPADVIGRSHG